MFYLDLSLFSCFEERYKRFSNIILLVVYWYNYSLLLWLWCQLWWGNIFMKSILRI